MNYIHNRAPSELEKLTLRDIIPVFAEALVDNFEFADIKERVTHLFTTSEINAIFSEPTCERQAYRLLFTLEEKDELVTDKLVELLQHEYKFIKDPIMCELEQPSSNTKIYLDEIRKLTNADPLFGFNVHRIEPFLELVAALKELKRCEHVVLSGYLGTGKKWLTRDVCCVFSVQKSMDFQIYWLNMKNCTSPENDLGMLQQLRHLMDPTYNDTDYAVKLAPTIENRIMHLKIKLNRDFKEKQYRNCLIILADVQNTRTLKAFNLNCKILVITRFKHVCAYLSAKTTKHIQLDDNLTSAESDAIYAKLMKYKNITCTQLQQNNINLNPLAIARDSKKLTRIVEESLNVLKNTDQEYFKTLIIFPDGVEIPIELLALLWHKTQIDTMDIIKTFDNYSFVSINFETNTITLPNIYSMQLKKSEKLSDTNFNNELHKKVVDAFGIPAAFDKRSDAEITINMPNYFFSHIGHHLSHLEEIERKELFRKIYLDFGFLEKKLRIESCTIYNTIQELKFYEPYICDNDERIKYLISAICEFLLKVQEKIIHSKDTCLLQYALFENAGPVYEEACRQAQLFPQQTWFNESGNFHQCRQIITFDKQQIQFVKYLHEDNCLVVLNNNTMLLNDISIEGNCGQTEFQGVQSTVKEPYVFLNEHYLLTLHNEGDIIIWSIWDDGHRRQLVQRRSSKQKINPYLAKTDGALVRQQSNRHVQKPKQIIKMPNCRIIAFHVETTRRKNEIFLHLAYENGDILVYEWHNEMNNFIKTHTPRLCSQQKNIRYLTKVLHKYYVLMTATGIFSVWNLQNTSKLIERAAITNENDNVKIVHMTSYDYISYENDCQYTAVLFVFSNKLLTLNFKHENLSKLENETFEPQLLYDHSITTDCGSSITCAKLSNDQRYILLGTEEGILVFDIQTKLPMLRSNVSDNIACVDICDLDDNIYIIFCGAVGKCHLNIHALRRNDDSSGLSWLHNVDNMNSANNSTVKLEPDTCLRGGKLYDIRYDECDNVHLLAVDSKSRIHQVCTNNKNDWTTIVPKQTKDTITAVTTYGKQITLVGYNNGDIYDISNKFNTDGLLVLNMEKPITYMQLLDDQILLASTNCMTYILGLPKFEILLKLEFNCMQIYKISEQQVLLLNNTVYHNQNSMLFLDLLPPQKHYYRELEPISGFDYKNTYLFLATFKNIKSIYKLTCENNELGCQLLVSNDELQLENNVNVSFLTASNDASIFAVGHTNGDIEVCKFHDFKSITFIYRLQSHTKPIYDMKFSPFNDVLVSCSEQLCIWSVAYMRNNPLTAQRTQLRRSSRFSTQQSCDINLKTTDMGTEEVDAIALYPHRRNSNSSVEHKDDLYKQTLAKNLERAWLDKHGPITKSELLSCIKFDGNRAQKFFTNHNFTKFNAIDDEGVYYDLELRKSYNLMLDSVNYKNNVAAINLRQTLTVAAAAANVDVDDNDDFSGGFGVAAAVANDCNDNHDNDNGIDVISDAISLNASNTMPLTATAKTTLPALNLDNNDDIFI